MQPVRRPIKPLSDPLINQIAAGEVVERPSSIVKELVENSLDAGARTIKVEVRNGGIDFLAVDDDGDGIPCDELPLALTRHCTSKLTNADELHAIVSLGFRGEALASIGAVAELSLTSRVADVPHGFVIEARPSRGVGDPKPAQRARGTRVEVRDLFATIPARRKFLRRAATEMLALQQLLRGLAFCVPAVSFELHAEQRRLWFAPAALDARANAQRWRTLFGAEFARTARYFDLTQDGLRVYGWLAPADASRSQADLQYLAVNGRLVKDRQLLHAIRTAYAEALPAGRFAAFAVHLELPPADVDVNVHPSKTEVRFRRVRDVHDVVHAAARYALDETSADSKPTMHLPASEIREGYPRARDTYRFSPTRVPDPAPNNAAHGTSNTLLAGRYLVVETAGGALTITDILGVVGAITELPEAATLTRPLVLPERFTVTDATFEPLLRRAAEWGFCFTSIATATWVLRGVPVLLPTLSTAQLVAAVRASGAELNHLVRASAAALKMPADAAARTGWLAEWSRALSAHGIELARFTRVLSCADIAALFK